MPTEHPRRCPSCRATFPSRELRPLHSGGTYRRKGGSGLRRCPRCGYAAFPQAFAVVGGTRPPVSYAMLN